MAAPAPPSDPHQFEQAVNAFRKRVPMKKGEFEELESAERERAFTVAGVAQLDVIADVWRAMDSAIEKGEDFNEFQAKVSERLSDSWGSPNAPRIETIFRTNIQNAYSAGRYEIYSAPKVKEARPYLRFDAIHDDATDEDCEACDDTILPQDDPFWANATPPLHFNCRCVVTPLSKDDVDERDGPDEEAPDVEGDEGFGERPTAEAQDWKPELGEYPEPLRRIADEKF